MTNLYRHFDKDGRLLYVGISLDAIVRLRQHVASAEWAGLIATITIERHPSRDEAVAAELKAIRTENPIYNRAGRAEPEDCIDGAWEMRKVEFWIAHGFPLPGQGRFVPA